MSSAEDLLNGGDGIPTFSRRHRMKLSLEYAGMSVNQMAELQGKNRMTITSWLSGRHEPDLNALRMWAIRTGVSLDWLIGDEPIGRPKAHRVSPYGYPAASNNATSPNSSDTSISRPRSPDGANPPEDGHVIHSYPHHPHAA